ncbi:serine hydrolase domain-containing protein [Agrococcus sp. ARC_14]|uniref:serine hydrolase domain-containing protein n=1 Tax=Agrococcus sp. ARC_14 TaxID=2919927 RepID=UPI001F0541C1|nr:serine hydrolase domain-containing protein [Agrococcus sp. ARC_14]MCH1881706.1 beta-lactamase family protein [Agrococcus sp. ARC_14]
MRTPKMLITGGALVAVVALAGAGAVPPDAPGDPAHETTLHEQLWQSPAVESLRTAEPDAAGAQDPHRQIEAALEQAVADGAIGATARVETATGDWADAAGTRGLESRAPALEHSPFRAASNTKMMVAALVLQEVEAGTWSLDSTIGEVVPGLLSGHPNVTLRQLLSHTAGTPNGTLELLLSRMADPADVDELVEVIGQRFPDAEHVAAANAGAWTAEGEYAYSNAAYVVLGVALEVVTGETVPDLLEERIFDPLRMRQTSVAEEPGLRGTAMQEAFWDGERWHDLRDFDPTFFSHAGSVVSTTRDLSTFTEALITGELVSQELVEQMIVPVTEETGYGLGIYRVPDPCVPGDFLYGHDGAAMGTISVAYTSADGQRQLTFGISGMDRSGSQEPLYDIGAVLQPMLAASCG